jgi:hypothetical protein
MIMNLLCISLNRNDPFVYLCPQLLWAAQYHTAALYKGKTTSPELYTWIEAQRDEIYLLIIKQGTIGTLLGHPSSPSPGDAQTWWHFNPLYWCRKEKDTLQIALSQFTQSVRFMYTMCFAPYICYSRGYMIQMSSWKGWQTPGSEIHELEISVSTSCSVCVGDSVSIRRREKLFLLAIAFGSALWNAHSSSWWLGPLKVKRLGFDGDNSRQLFSSPRILGA